MAKSIKPGILCLEGDWDPADPASRKTIEPALELLERMDFVTLHHRNVNTMPELWRHLDHWDSKAFEHYRFLYMGFHGEPGVIDISGDRLGLDTLAANLEGRCTDRVIFLSSCGVLESREESLKEFCRKTGADAIVGYTAEVDFIEAAAFEMILFDYMRGMAFGSRPPRALFKEVTTAFPDFAYSLGLRVATKTWVSQFKEQE